MTTYTYYDDGRMSNERVAADGSMQWLYDEAGKMRRIQVMDYRVTYVYDDADRMTRLISFHRTDLVTMTDFQYAYDKAGNRTRVAELGGSDPGSGRDAGRCPPLPLTAPRSSKS